MLLVPARRLDREHTVHHADKERGSVQVVDSHTLARELDTTSKRPTIDFLNLNLVGVVGIEFDTFVLGLVE